MLSFVVIGCAFGWEHYLENKTDYPPILRTSLLTRKAGRFALVCFVIVSLFLSAPDKVMLTLFSTVLLHGGK